ncbi:MAG: NAD(P)H-dependent glycerol-3-phosphate dehydrogenase [Nanobdellota archaeon]
MSSICIIGAGSFGTALAMTFAEKHKVLLIDRDSAVVDDINHNHRNKQYMKGLKLSKNISASTDINDVASSDILIIAVPSHAMSIIAKQLEEIFPRNTPIISATKGLSSDGRTMTSILEDYLDTDPKRIFALSGPSIARELAERSLTDMVLGGNKRLGRTLANDLSTETLRLKVTSDKFGIQLLGFYKNIIAIMVGVCEGLGLGTNTTSALVTTAYRELYRKNIKRMKRHTFIDHSGLGDLLVTMYSQKSRNHHFGLAIGQGNTVKESLRSISQVVEGLNGIRLLSRLDDDTYFDSELIKTLESIMRAKTKESKKRLLEFYLKKKE